MSEKPFPNYSGHVEGTSVGVGPSSGSRYIEQGNESIVKTAGISIVEDGQLLAEMPNGFVLKTVSPELEKINPDFAEKRLEKMNALREINVQQSKIGGHIFNIPNTTRIVIQNDGTKALLETDITEGGRLDLIDLKNFRGYEFDEGTRTFIIDHIKEDVQLASKYGLTLSHWQNNYAPLDTWNLVIDPATGEKKLYIIDVGHSVELQQTPEELEKGEQKIDEVLEEIKLGDKTQMVGPAFPGEIDEEKTSL